MPSGVYKRLSLERRFWSKVDKRGPDECWPWVGSRGDEGGYGMISVGGRKVKAHRVAYHLAHPEWSLNSPLRICHSCDNRPCCNEAHLWPGTQSENIRDMFQKGRKWKRNGTSNGRCRTLDEIIVIVRSQIGTKSQRTIARELEVSQTLVWKIQTYKKPYNLLLVEEIENGND